MTAFVRKWYWFIVISVIFLLDNGISALYYLVPYETDADYQVRVIIYTMSVSLVNSFIYLYIAFFRPKMQLRLLDKLYSVVCALVTAFSSIRCLFDAINMSDLWYWALFFIFFFILIWFKVKERI